MNTLQGVFTICIIALILNLPFGWLRTYTKRFSIPWAVCIHAPIPMIAFIRIYTGIDWVYIPVFLVFSVAGQIIGGKLKEKLISS